MKTKILTLEGFDRDVKVYLKQVHSDPLIKMKKYDGCSTGIGASIDKNGLPVTGLTEDSVGPKTSGAIPKKIHGTRKAMEKELDLPEGSLKNTSPFYSKYFIKVESDPVEMDLRNPHDLQKYLFALAQSNVANGLDEISERSGIEFVLYSEEQVARDKVTSRRALKDAYVLSDKLDIETKIQILAVYGEIADATSPNSIINAIEERIEENPKEFLKIAGDPALVIRSLLNRALDKGIFITEEGAIYHGEIVVGHTTDLAVAALIKDKTLQTIVRAKLSGDMDIISAALSKAKEETKEA